MASSGDVLADRRYAYAEAAFRDGEPEAAADLARQALELAPGFGPAWFLLGQALEARLRQGHAGPEDAQLAHDAVEAFQAALAADPEDRQGARARLASLGVGDPLQAMSPGYVRALFDEYAIRFDRHLTRSLKYRAPELLHGAVRRACSRARRTFRFASCLDLGCGTGLAGELFRPDCERLAGVDLSPAMIERARRKKLYDELSVEELGAWLGARPADSADLALAADVFVYLGDLSPTFAALARVLAPGGLLAFTVEAHEGEGVRLGSDLRYAHGQAFLEIMTERHGFRTLVSESASTREERSEPVPGRVIVIEREQVPAGPGANPPRQNKNLSV